MWWYNKVFRVHTFVTRFYESNFYMVLHLRFAYYTTLLWQQPLFTRLKKDNFQNQMELVPSVSMYTFHYILLSMNKTLPLTFLEEAPALYDQVEALLWWYMLLLLVKGNIRFVLDDRKETMTAIWMRLMTNSWSTFIVIAAIISETLERGLFSIENLRTHLWQ